MGREVGERALGPRSGDWRPRLRLLCLLRLGRYGGGGGGAGGWRRDFGGRRGGRG